jgi:hypothetical protein
MKQNTKATGNGKTVLTIGKTLNKAGEEAFELKDREKLVTGILTCLVNEPTYYGDTTPDVIKVARKLIQTDPEFVAKAACYARNVFHMRSISHVLAAEVAKGAKGSNVVRKMTRKIIERADDITNILSYHFKTWGKRKKDPALTVTQSDNPVSRALRRGIADVFPRFDEYSLAKYKGDDNDVKLRDALLLSRPKPTNEAQTQLWKKLIEGKLATPETRETILSEKGQSKETWEKIIDGKAGYMMLLRNLKNILENKVSQSHLDKVCTIISDTDQVKKSKQFPFRFFSAYREVENLGSLRSQQVLDALENALNTSFENLPKLAGTTAIIVDQSGSMDSPLSEKSKINLRDVGNLLAAAALKFCDRAVTIPFGYTAKVISLSSRNNIFANMTKMENSGVGHSTYLISAFEEIDKLDEKIDRILIFSDMQAYGEVATIFGYFRRPSTPLYNSCQAWFEAYKQKVPALWLHSFDLAGHSTTKVAGKGVNLISGWSEKVFDYVSQVEEGRAGLIKAIEEYVI